MARLGVVLCWNLFSLDRSFLNWKGNTQASRWMFKDEKETGEDEGNLAVRGHAVNPLAWDDLQCWNM